MIAGQLLSGFSSMLQMPNFAALGAEVKQLMNLYLKMMNLV